MTTRKPGRKPRASTARRGAPTISTRAAPEEQDRWRALAAEKGIDLSSLIRALLETARDSDTAVRAEVVTLRAENARLRAIASGVHALAETIRDLK